METAYVLKESIVEAVSRAASCAVDVPFGVVDAEMNIRLLRGGGEFGKNVSALIEGGLSGAGDEARAAALALRVAQVERGGRVLCYVIAPSGRGELAADYLKVLIAAECDAEGGKGTAERKRTMLVSQLAGSGRIDS